jgi:tetratricopeptide (TPR) repeat protein
LEAVCLKCLEYEPKRRYATAGALAADLKRYLAEQPVSVRRAGAVVRMVKWSRRKPLVAALCFGLAVSVVVGFAAVTWQWRVAENNRLAAEANFREAHAAVRAFHNALYAEDAYDAPQFHPLRKAMLKKALVYYQSLLDKHEHHPELRANIAEAWIHKGFLAHTQGDSAEAARCYRRAIPICETLVKEEPDEWEHRYYLAKAYGQLGGLQLRNGRLSEAKDLFERALAIREDLCRQRPGESSHQREWTDALSSLASFHSAQRDWETALEFRRTARQATFSLVEQEPEVADHRRRLADIDREIGSLLFWLKRYDAAAEAVLQAEANLRWLVDQGLADALAERSLGSTLTVLGRIHREQGRGAAALAAYESAIDVFRKLSNVYPEMPRYQFSLNYSRTCLAEALEEQGDTARALALHIEVCRSREELAALQPGIARRSFDVAVSYHHIGVWHMRFGEPQSALAALNRTQNILDTLVHENPAWVQATQRLMMTWFAISELLLDKLDRPQDGTYAYGQAVAYRRRLVEDLAPQDAEAKQQLLREAAELVKLRAALAGTVSSASNRRDLRRSD